jgi:hypothetical protein
MRGESPGESPQTRDLVVSPHPVRAQFWSLRQVPGEPQLLYASRDDAVLAGRRFARAQHVNLWYCDDRQCTLLLNGHTVDT